MKLTNTTNLPAPVVNALKSYEREYTGNNENEISVTTLIGPAKIRRLKAQHGDELTEDVSSMLWGLMGKAVHTILEKHALADTAEIIEKRFHVNIDGHKITGQVDRYFNGVLQDWKLASVWEYIYGVKPEKIAQLNIYAFMLREHGHRVERLENVFFFRDFSLSKARFDSQYPQNQIETIEVEMWPRQKTYEYICDRLKAHFEQTADCTPDEQWAKPEKYAVYKGQNKRAAKLCDTEDEAIAYIDNHKDAAKMRIDYRPGEKTRCRDYCQVNAFCDQYKAEN